MILDRFRILIAYVFAVPLALLLGFLVASPGELTFVVVGFLLFFLMLPLLMKWHHVLLIIFWNSAFAAFFLPGAPQFWFFFAVLSFGISFLNYIMGSKPFVIAREMNRPLFCLYAVILFTALFHGGIGLRAMGGGQVGGRYYFWLFFALIGYYALTAVHIPLHKARKLVAIFFLSAATTFLSNIVYFLGPAFYFLYWILPSGSATLQAAAFSGSTSIDRLQGLGPASPAAMACLLALYGARGLFDLRKPWRFMFFCIAMGASFFSGFRSAFLVAGLIFACQVYFEKLLRTRFLPVLIGVGALTLVLIMMFANKMPLSAQRAISFLPVNVDSEARADAEGSIQWRLEMWSIVIKDIPKYLLVGKGYGMDATENAVLTEAARAGLPVSPFDIFILSGDYHNGPLSVLMPFGLFGFLAFLWVLYKGFRILHGNYQWGDPRLKVVNTALLSFYTANVISFVLIFGAFNSQFFVFLGVIGVSLSLNRGVAGKTQARPDTAQTPAGRAFAVETS